MKTVRIVSPDGLAHSTQITNSESGEEIPGVIRVDIEIVAAKECRAKLELGLLQTDITATAEFRMVDPKTGELKVVKRIEFADGKSVDL
jgi:hypothetical protein